jgi:WD40 repeat protein
MEIKKIAQLTGHQAAVFAVGEGRTPQHIISGAGEGWLVEWDLATPDVGRLLAKVERNIFSLQFIKHQNRIVVGDMDGGVRFVNLNNPEHTLNIKHHSKGCFDIRLWENQLFTIGGEGTITRWSVEESRSLESLQLSTKSLRSLDICIGKREIAIGASDGNVYFLDLDTFDVKKTIKTAHSNSIFAVRYTPDGTHLLTGGRDAFLKLWNINSKERTPVFEAPAHLFTLNSIAFHPINPTIFATASRDRTIKIWQLNSLMFDVLSLKAGKFGIEGESLNSLQTSNLKLQTNPPSNFKLLKVIDTIRLGCHIRSVNRLFWSPFEDYLISVSDDRSLMVWAIE